MKKKLKRSQRDALRHVIQAPIDRCRVDVLPFAEPTLRSLLREGLVVVEPTLKGAKICAATDEGRGVHAKLLTKPLFRTTGITPVNPCGECTECCTTLSIPQLMKPPGKRCQFACDDGCSVYERRPKTCRTYDCLYRTGHVVHRPDRSGLLFERSYRLDGIRVVDVRELRLAAELSPMGEADLTDTIVRGAVVRLIKFGGGGVEFAATKKNTEQARAVAERYGLVGGRG